ncbi:MAG: hypothetical protein Q4D14_06065 [Bacteroidales bacterium]|nr:hypothetical protein [Bacteroidales bacterium]
MKKTMLRHALFMTICCLIIGFTACGNKTKNHVLSEPFKNHLEEVMKEANEVNEVDLNGVKSKTTYRVDADTIIITIEYDEPNADINDYKNLYDVDIFKENAILLMDAYDLLLYAMEDSVSVGIECALKDQGVYIRYVMPFPEIAEYVENYLQSMMENTETLEHPFDESDFVDLDWKASLKVIDDTIFGPLPYVVDETQTLTRLETNGNEHLLYFEVTGADKISQETIDEYIIPAYKRQLSAQYSVIADKLCAAKVVIHAVVHSTELDEDLFNFTVTADELFH